MEKESSKKVDLSGQRRGRLLIIKKLESQLFKGRKVGLYKCLCDCGREVNIFSSMLCTYKSCGCLKKENHIKSVTKHNMSRSKEYVSWTQMKIRCYGDKNITNKIYQNKGVVVCDRWLNDFSAFYVDMGNMPIDKNSIDRINNDGNYEPSNCRWANRVEQQNNTSKNVYITYNGITKTIKQWHNEIGVKVGILPYRTFISKIRDQGYTLEDLINGNFKYKK